MKGRAGTRATSLDPPIRIGGLSFYRTKILLLVEESEIDRQFALLRHPLRRRILRSLDDQAASAAELARELGEPHGSVTYHARLLIDAGVLQLVGTEPVRGALARHYRKETPGWMDDVLAATKSLDQ